MEIFLNRLRGTGDIFVTKYFKITGTMLYALYIFILITILSNFVYGFVGAALLLVGESFAFGKWVGYLVDYENEHIPEYDSKVGKSFPYIHYIANTIVKEKVNYKLYCQVALTIRGFIWWTPLLILLGCVDLLSWFVVITNSIILSIGFPIACLIGRNWKYNKKFGILEFKQGWENQEIVYGVIQFICITLSLLLK